MGTKGNHLGEFEELVLVAVASLTSEAYGVSVMKYLSEEAKRSVNISAIHQGLKRLESKGLVTSHVGGATKVRGGRSKRYFELTETGQYTLKEIMELKIQLYNKVPNFSIKLT
ncbi:MAG: PadR family transcriptional regulator [Reichenbachiella sp.]|uniref:PadR family transcriptional regulator n=1 Tax=Reichenbachiella sp. TaxID=2184521 RepID=UPI0032645AC3